MLAIEAAKGPRKTQDKGRFGPIARGPLGQYRGKMLAKTKDRGVSLGGQVWLHCAGAPVAR